MHTQAARSLPVRERRWRELDSSMSSDALLMNVFCTPGVLESSAMRTMLGVARVTQVNTGTALAIIDTPLAG